MRPRRLARSHLSASRRPRRRLHIMASIRIGSIPLRVTRSGVLILTYLWKFVRETDTHTHIYKYPHMHAHWQAYTYCIGTRNYRNSFYRQLPITPGIFLPPPWRRWACQWSSAISNTHSTPSTCSCRRGFSYHCLPLSTRRHPLEKSRLDLLNNKTGYPKPMQLLWVACKNKQTNKARYTTNRCHWWGPLVLSRSINQT